MFSIQSKEKNGSYLFLSKPLCQNTVPAVQQPLRCSLSPRWIFPRRSVPPPDSKHRSPTRRLRAAKIPHSEMFVVFQAIEVSELILNLFCHNYIPLPRRKLDDSGAHLVGRTSNPHAPQQTRSQGPDVLHSRYRYTVLLYRRLIFVSVWVIASPALKNKQTKKVT